MLRPIAKLVACYNGARYGQSLITSRKSCIYMPLHLTPKSTTLDDPEGRTALYWTNDASFGAHHGNLKEDRPTLSGTKMSAWTLLSGGVKPSRFKESSVRAHQIWVPPWKRAIYATVDTTSTEWLQIHTFLLRIITSTADELSGGTNIDDLVRPWTPKIWVLSDFWLF